MSVTKSSSSQVNATVAQFYKAVTVWDFDVLEKLFSEDYEHKTLPASANDPPKNKQQGIEYAKAVGASLGFTKLNVRDRRSTIARASDFDVFSLMPAV